jgi:threonine dehydratase
MLEDDPGLDAIIVPVGGGSGAAGACIVAEALRPATTVIGVQSEAAPAAQRSWSTRQLVSAGMETFAEGLATRVAFELPQRILWRQLDEFLLVSEADLRAATARMIAATSSLVEAAAGAPLAAAMRLRGRLAGKRVALIASGGNISLEQLRDLLARVDAG